MRALACLFVFTSLISLLALAACKQSEGDYCQVNSDCKAGLVCVSSTSTCGKSSTGGGIDAGALDAEPIDAMTPDSTPLPLDAMPIDAP